MLKCWPEKLRPQKPEKPQKRNKNYRKQNNNNKNKKKTTRQSQEPKTTERLETKEATSFKKPQKQKPKANPSNKKKTLNSRTIVCLVCMQRFIQCLLQKRSDSRPKGLWHVQPLEQRQAFSEAFTQEAVWHSLAILTGYPLHAGCWLRKVSHTKPEPFSSRDRRTKRGAKLIWKARIPSTKRRAMPMDASSLGGSVHRKDWNSLKFLPFCSTASNVTRRVEKEIQE